MELNIVEEQIIIKGELLVLTNKRALYWQAERALILSDLHVGKTAHFRKHGIPIPDTIFQEDLHRLAFLVDHYKAEQLIIVGDLFHAEANSNMNRFLDWRQRFKTLKMILIKGNHDRLPESWMHKLDMIVTTQLEISPFLFVHDPIEKQETYFTLSGHIHPGVLIKGKGRQKVKLPCFAVSEHELILPAFSNFTGLNTRYGDKTTVYYAFTEKEIFKF